jgi:deoxyribonuclease V
MCDGQGTAHPRGMGLASHLGLLLARPTIGCAKSPLVGAFSSLKQEKGRFRMTKSYSSITASPAVSSPSTACTRGS